MILTQDELGHMVSLLHQGDFEDDIARLFRNWKSETPREPTDEQQLLLAIGDKEHQEEDQEDS
jgi:hypothetical protein